MIQRDPSAMDGGILDPQEHVELLAETGLDGVWRRYQHTHDWPPAISLGFDPGDGYCLYLEVACPICERWVERMGRRVQERFAPRQIGSSEIALILYGVLSPLQDPDLVEELESPLP